MPAVSRAVQIFQPDPGNHFFTLGRFLMVPGPEMGFQTPSALKQMRLDFFGLAKDAWALEVSTGPRKTENARIPRSSSSIFLLLLVIVSCNGWFYPPAVLPLLLPFLSPSPFPRCRFGYSSGSGPDSRGGRAGP